MNGINISTASEIRLGNTLVSEIYFGYNKLWPLGHDYSQDYFTIVSSSDNNTISWYASTSSIQKTISISTDGGTTWTQKTSSTTTSGETLAILNTGDKMLIKGNNTTYANSKGNTNTFKASGYFTVEGNIMSLIYEDNFIGHTILDSTGYNFRWLFGKCSYLTSIENLILPATTLANYCYYKMFQGCTSLTTAPSELPATTLTPNCYQSMFNGCTSLTTTPSLPATTLTNNCYQDMFQNCSALTTAPQLPATTLAPICYYGMFKGCSALTTAPELPATTLATQCYAAMFQGCTSLRTAPELPATTLAGYCYNSMFRNCTSLNYIKCLATDISATGCTTAWVDGVSATGTFVKNASMTSWTIGNNGIPSGWIVQNVHDYSQDYLTIVSSSDNNTISWKAGNANLTKTINISTDGGTTWTQKTSDTTSVTLATLNTDNKMLVKGNNTTYANSSDYNYYNCFTSTDNFNVEGNIMSLIYGDNFIGQTTLDSTGYNFYRLFYNCNKLISTENLILPATTLANNCYQDMFRNCTSLTTAPQLPATTLAEICYDGMFMGCTSLTTAPKLPATTLTPSCYSDMFFGCTALTSAPSLPATTLTYGCYSGMFCGCTSLTTAPELPATTLATLCYDNMFQSCTSLNYIKCLATDISATGCTTVWVIGVSASGTFVKDASMTSWTTGTSGIPSGWTIQNA